MHKAEVTRVLLAGTMLTVLVGLMPAGSARAVVPFAQVGRAIQAAAIPRANAAPPVRQLITVTAVSRTTTYATFRAYQVSAAKRVLVLGPWTARVGYNGIAAPGRKREGDGRTPSGTYGFSFFFGVDRDLGFAFPFRHAYPYDYWDDDPKSPRYNEWINARQANPGADPEPMHNVPAYEYAAVIAYNTARKPGLGSAIFLHVGTGTATAGCVSLPKAELLKVLHWLHPAGKPTISITG
jgi:L,D-peptidoglycan transpeptidase YkuD (ErfK/YbiS/YcfS/YnhG family)